VERLPIKFEEEVLSKHGIKYSEYSDGYVSLRYCDDCCGMVDIQVSFYELAGIALEAMKDKLKHKGCVEIGCCNLYEKHMWEISYENWQVIEDKDFCTCVFQAVRETWGDK
jgi:hypothetical protein